MGCGCNPLGGGGFTPLQIPNALYVNASAPPGGNGSAITPFQTLTEALAVAVDAATIVVFPGDYSSEPTIDLGDRSLTFYGIGAIGASPGGLPTGPQFPDVDWTVTAIQRYAFFNCIVGFIGTDEVELFLYDCDASTDTACEATIKVHGGFFVGGVGDSFVAAHCELGALQGNTSGDTEAHFIDSSCTGNLTDLRTLFRDCMFTAGLTATSGGSTFRFDGFSLWMARNAGVTFTPAEVDLVDQDAIVMNWGCITLSAAAAGSILTPWSKDFVSGPADTNKWIVAKRSGTLRYLRAKMRIAHTQNITFTVAQNFVATALTVTVVAGQTDGTADIPVLVTAGDFLTATAVAADALGAEFSMDATCELQ